MDVRAEYMKVLSALNDLDVLLTQQIRRARKKKCRCGRLVVGEVDGHRMCARCLRETKIPPPGHSDHPDWKVLGYYRRQKDFNLVYHPQERHYTAAAMPRAGWNVVSSGAFQRVHYHAEQ